MKVNVPCKVEQTKSDKWLRLTPTEKAPIAAVTIKATDVPHGAQAATVTVAF